MDRLQNYLEDIKSQFSKHKELVEKSIQQISEEQFFHKIDEESNSIASIIKHLSGNLASRWSDFLFSDGEKPDRNRDTEFISGSDSRENLMHKWENAWNVVMVTLEHLTVEDLSKTITIRSEPHTVIEALNRGLTHCAYHTGQIVFLAKHFSGKDWNSLSIPKGKSVEFTNKLKQKWSK